MVNVAIYHALDVAPTEGVRYANSAWLTYRDRLATRAQRDPQLWLSVETFYGVLESLPETQAALIGELVDSLHYAVANFDGLELSIPELVPVYGLRAARAEWRKRSRRGPPPASEPVGDP